MNKPKVGILVSRGVWRMVGTADELKRLKSFAAVNFRQVEQLTPEVIKKFIRNADGVISGWGTPLLTGDYLDRAPKLRIIAHSAGSVKPFVTDEVWKRKIVVTTAAPSTAIGVAEFTLGLLLCGLKRVFALNERSHQPDAWWGDNEERTRIHEFYKTTTIGLVGAGFVGRHVIKLLKNFDARVLLYDPYVSREEAAGLGVRKVSLNRLLKESHAVSLHAPSVPATRHMINRQNLALMKENALLVNTARGSLIDEAALIEVLRRGKIYACLDVTDPEPPAKDSPFRQLKNVILTPHIAGAAHEGAYRQFGYAVTELQRFFSGKKPMYPVTKEMLAKMA